MEYNERIKQYRTQKSVTQQQLADEVGVSRQSVVRWENGITVPSMYYAQKLATYFGVTVTELMTGETESEQSVQPDRSMRVKCGTSTAVFCVIVFLTVIMYAIVCNLIQLYNYRATQRGDELIALKSTVKMLYGIVDGAVVAALAAELVFWCVKLFRWLNTTDDKYMWYRIYKPWSIGIAVWIANALTVVLFVYINVMPAPVLFIAAAFAAIPIFFAVDFVAKKAFGSRMVVPRNKTLGIINLVYSIIAAACVAALVVWVLYAVIMFHPTYGLEVAFAVLYFCIAAAVIELSYIIVRVTVHFVAARKQK